MGSCGYHMCRLGGVAAHTTGMSPPTERVSSHTQSSNTRASNLVVGGVFVIEQCNLLIIFTLVKSDMNTENRRYVL